MRASVAPLPREPVTKCHCAHVHGPSFPWRCHGESIGPEAHALACRRGPRLGLGARVRPRTHTCALSLVSGTGQGHLSRRFTDAPGSGHPGRPQPP